MHRITRFRPTPAMFVASIALLVALGGTSVAAVKALAPANSVGTAAVIDNSLLKKDFKTGQIPGGKPGPAGPSDAFSRSIAGVVALTNAVEPVASLAIPKPGKYVIWAKALVGSTSNDEVISCTLSAGGDSDSGRVYLPRPFATATVSYLLVYSSAAAGKADFACGGTTTPVKSSASQIELVAIKVANLTSA